MPLETLVAIIVGGILLLLAWAVVQLLTDVAPESSRAEVRRGLCGTLSSRIDMQLSLVDVDESEELEVVARRLLSMGPGIIPLLLARLKALEEDPAALSARAQFLVEDVLKGFGLQTWAAVAPLMRDVHRASPLYPALIRVLVGLGPQVVAALASVPNPPDSAALLVPVMARLEPQITVAMRLEHEGGVPPHPGFILACLPVFAVEPAMLERALLQVDPTTRHKLLAALGPWPLPQQRAIVTAALDEDVPAIVAWAIQERAIQILASADGLRASRATLLSLFRRGLLTGEVAADVAWQILLTLDPREALMNAQEHVEHSLLQYLKSFLDNFDEDPRSGAEEALKALESSVDDEGLAALWALGAMLDDPRAVERLVDLARTSRGAPGALALVTLSRAGLGPLEALVAARVRMAGATAGAARLWLRIAVVAIGEPVVEGLLRLLRVESSGTASTAALLVAPLSPDAPGVLKAVGRHRYSPIESQVAPLIWAKWPQCSDQVEAALSHPDREVVQAALIMIGALGDPHQVDALVDLLEKRPALAELTLNSIELLGPAVSHALERLIEREPVLATTYHLRRRASLLKVLAEE